MSELFIELFSEDIPPKLQIDARLKIKKILEEKLQAKEIFTKSELATSIHQRRLERFSTYSFNNSRRTWINLISVSART